MRSIKEIAQYSKEDLCLIQVLFTVSHVLQFYMSSKSRVIRVDYHLQLHTRALTPEQDALISAACNDKDKDNHKDKDKDKMTKRPNMCHIFENAMTQGCQI